MSPAKWRPFCLSLNMLNKSKQATNWMNLNKQISMKKQGKSFSVFSEAHLDYRKTTNTSHTLVGKKNVDN